MSELEDVPVTFEEIFKEYKNKILALKETSPCEREAAKVLLDKIENLRMRTEQALQERIESLTSEEKSMFHDQREIEDISRSEHGNSDYFFDVADLRVSASAFKNEQNSFAESQQDLSNLFTLQDESVRRGVPICQTRPMK